MRRPSPLLFRFPYAFSHGVHTPSRPPIIQIDNATFYRHHPSSAADQTAAPNPPLFPGLNFTLPSFSSEPQHWSILGPSNSGKTTFLEVLRGQHLCFPPGARSYPYLSSDEIAAKDHRLRIPGRAFQYVGFNGERGGLSGPGTRGAYLSARYESRREETDFLLLDYLQGHTELNPADETEGRGYDDTLLERVIKDLRLEDLVHMPVSNLSNGQTRRARIAKALLDRPEVLLLDEPFMGLDPPTLMTLSPLLHRLAMANAPRLVLALRPQDRLPEWITHLVYLDKECRVAHQGRKDEMLAELKGKVGLVGELPGADATHMQEDVATPKAKAKLPPSSDLPDVGQDEDLIGEELPPSDNSKTEGRKVVLSQRSLGMTEKSLKRQQKRALERSSREVLVNMRGVCVKYGEKIVLGNWTEGLRKKNPRGLWWDVRRGDRWGIFGPNGSGKTTLLSLICSDHPQTYALPMELFGQSRLPKVGQPGISIFDIQARIGHSSPEIHAFFPRHLSVRQTLETAWADTFLGKPQLNHDRDMDVDACLHWFNADLKPGSSALPKEMFHPSKGRGIKINHVTLSRKHEIRADLLRIEDTDIDWADELRFGELSFSAQRVALFIRAMIKKPDIVILDEAFSGMDEHVRDKCKLFLCCGQERTWVLNTAQTARVQVRAPRTLISAGGPRFSGLSQEQALLCVSHVKEEVPDVVREWICLPEANTGQAPRQGRLHSPMCNNWAKWDMIWGF